MAINRRDFIRFLMLAGIGSRVPSFAAATDKPLVIGACRLTKDTYGLSAVDLNGELIWQQTIPSRGHDIAVHQSKAIAIAVARRPGQWLRLLHLANGETLQTLHMPEHWVLNGHAVWLQDDLIVTASERTDSTLRLLRYSLQHKQLVLRETKAFAHVGAHEVIRHENLLHIAIGGLLTQGRDVLNKTDFQSGVLTLDATTLETINYSASPAQHVSLRHLSSNETGKVFIAGQYQLDTRNSEPLLYALANNQLTAFKADPQLWSRLKGYLGSILASQNSVIATSPRAHWLGAFHADTLSLKTQMLSHDVCALALSRQGIVAGTGTGKLWLDNQSIESHVIWDNHFIVNPTVA